MCSQTYGRHECWSEILLLSDTRNGRRRRGSKVLKADEACLFQGLGPKPSVAI